MDFSNPLFAYLAVFLAGLVASASPCTLIIFPLIISYVGGYAEGDVRKSALYSLFFAVGLAITYTILGAIAALTGELLGALGGYWKYLLAAIAVAVGLNLIGLIQVNIPTTGVSRIKQKGVLGALLLGLLFGLVTSPCATPVLALILAYVAATKNLFYGISLLFVYALAYMTMIFIVGVSAGVATALLSSTKFQQLSALVQKSAGIVFILAGIYWLFML